MAIEGPRDTPIPHPFWDMLWHCESYCLIDCCGANSLDLSKSNVLAWVDKVGLETARRAADQIEALYREIAGHGRRVNSLTDIWENQAFLEWLDECQTALSVALEPVGENTPGFRRVPGEKGSL